MLVLVAYVGLFNAPFHRIMKPSGCFVGLPVSRREPRCRCGGRRGGLNDSQHCAVGPGLQSPQRWSFPPASISLAVSLHSTRSSSSLSIQPFRYAEASIFSHLAPLLVNPTEGDYFYSAGRPCLISSEVCTPSIEFMKVVLMVVLFKRNQLISHIPLT